MSPITGKFPGTITGLAYNLETVSDKPVILQKNCCFVSLLPPLKWEESSVAIQHIKSAGKTDEIEQKEKLKKSNPSNRTKADWVHRLAPQILKEVRN